MLVGGSDGVCLHEARWLRLLLAVPSCSLRHLPFDALPFQAPRSDVPVNRLAAWFAFGLTRSRLRSRFRGLWHRGIHEVGFFKDRTECTWCWNVRAQNSMHVWSRVGRGFLSWLSFGLHINVPTLSTPLAAVEQFRRQGFYSVGRLAHLLARAFQQASAHGDPKGGSRR